MTWANDLGVKHLPSLFALRTLEAAVRHGSYSAAARELAVTQGAVSQQIRKLEAEVGAQLFHRSGNTMVPTAEAARLAREIAATLGRLQSALGEFEAVSDVDPLVLSIDARFSNRWLAPKLSRLLADPAGARLEIRVEDRVANFISDGVDVGVRFGRGDWPPLLAERLTTDRLYVVCTPEFAERYGVREPKDLLAAPLVHSGDRPWSMLFDRYGLPTPSASLLMAQESALVLHAVSQGLAAGIVMSSMVDDDLRAGRLVRAVPDAIPLPMNYVHPGQLVRTLTKKDPPAEPYGYFFAWRPDNAKQRRILALRDWFVAEARAVEAGADLALLTDPDVQGIAAGA
jgi:LysR family glycine cleavage system transcriptional activator